VAGLAEVEEAVRVQALNPMCALTAKSQATSAKSALNPESQGLSDLSEATREAQLS
jgi:hypothetical protein